MELGGRPLLDNASDRRLYVEHPEATRLREAAANGLNTLVLGARGSGKSTLLRQVALDLREEDRPSVFVDAAIVDSPLALLQIVRLEAGRAPTLVDAMREAFRAPLAPMSGLGENGGLLELVRSLRAPLDMNDKVVLLVDALPAAKVAHPLFGRLRDELWQLPFTWVVAGDQAERGEFLTPPADAFFEEIVELQPLSADEQRRLITLRLGDEVDQAPWVKHLHAKTPRELLALVRQGLRAGAEPDALLRARAERERKVSRLGRAASMLIAELEASGPSSASDPDLLHRLGWSRQRAAQVFAQLEEEGILQGHQQRGPSGHNRKLYAFTETVST
jgi:energy-coupling factor transporter ATP-binding protein EcfA2